MLGPCCTFHTSSLLPSPRLTLIRRCTLRTMDSAGPSSSHKRPPSSPLAAAAQRELNDIIDLTEDDNLTESNKSNSVDAPLHLFRVRGIPNWANSGFQGEKLGTLVAGPMQWALVSNYMIDMPWLLSACPDLVKIPSLLVCHGESGSAAMAIQRTCVKAGMNGRYATHSVPVPQYGTHHSKAFFIQYPTGFRVIIHTANLLYCDVNNKSQSLYTQDFPRKERSTLSTSPFERDLLDYIIALKLPPLQASKVINIIKMHDFSAARVHLIASIPSEFSGAQMNKYGYLKLKTCLENEPGGFPRNFRRAPIVCQYSSIGSLSTKWLASFIESLSAGKITEATNSSLGPPSGGVADPSNIHLIWPTAEEVQNSIEGWFAGGSIPGYPEKVQRDFLQQYYRRFGGQVAGRQRAMPHMKSYTRFDPETKEIAWFCVTSHNLSKAAWGEQQNSKKYDLQLLKILSYELGVLLVPSLEKAYRQSRHYGFSCTSTRPQSARPMAGSEDIQRVKFVQWQQGESQAALFSSDGTVLTVPLPIPYPLPPESYIQGQDVPWSVSTMFPGVDSQAMPCPGIGTHYGLTDDMEWGDIIEALKGGAGSSLKRSFE